MRVTVTEDQVARDEPAISCAVLRIADVIPLVTRIAAARADDPVSLAARSGRSRTATAPMITWAGTFRIVAIEVRARRSATRTDPTSIPDGIAGPIRDPALPRSAGTPVTPQETIVAGARSGVAAGGGILITHPAEVSIHRNRDGCATGIGNARGRKGRSFVNTDAAGRRHLPGRIADTDRIGALALVDAAKAGLRLARFKNQAGAADHDDAGGEPADETAAREGARQMRVCLLNQLIHFVCEA